MSGHAHLRTGAREQIKIQGVKAKRLPGISFIRVRTFNETTVADVAVVLTEQNAQMPLKGVVSICAITRAARLMRRLGCQPCVLPKDAMVVYTEGRNGRQQDQIFSPAVIIYACRWRSTLPTCRRSFF